MWPFECVKTINTTLLHFFLFVTINFDNCFILLDAAEMLFDEIKQGFYVCWPSHWDGAV